MSKCNYIILLYRIHNEENIADESNYTITCFSSLLNKSLSSVLSANGPVPKLGKLACAHALPCFKRVVKQIADCASADDSFYTKAAEKARALLDSLMVEHSGFFEESVICHFGAESDAMTLFSLVSTNCSLVSYLKLSANFNKSLIPVLICIVCYNYLNGIVLGSEPNRADPKIIA